MNKTIHILGCLILLGGLGGCASQSSTPPSQYYLLSSDSQSYIKETYQRVIGIQPVKVAPYINTPGIALLTRENHIRIANQHLWAEQPDQAITRVLHNKLDQRLPTSRVDDGSLGRNNDWNYSIATQIDQFHGTETGEAVLSGHWQIKQGEQVISTYRFNLKQPLEKPGYTALVTELQTLLSNLAEQQASYLKPYIAKQ
ncbi:membrane integrity-associated transporter subunit PqiC [Neptuniibacter sp. QD72_48]|uniref:PqiC family protein n=1 Tax=unclassified Neptuniibacter TaxID=2630693 RepID=UPI0039F6FD2A